MSNIIKNGKVVYVEPNIANDFTSYNSDNKGTVYKSVDLEDMCIIVDLEVEVKGRTYRSSYNGNQNNIELKWKSDASGERVSFMEGTKIPTSDGGFVKSLTTNYTDCHLFDIKDSGTAEMFGIKSIDISYDNFMVPEVTIQFIDVRGVSLFAQEETRHRIVESNGMTGLVDNGIEGSFFKCFFTFPYPKFTLKVKGFYGEMVSYELTCSDFRAAFNSNTGNFNVTAKFIGYAFSFLGDVMVNGLVSAPYSDYIGKKYWEDNLNNGRFSLEDGIGAIVDSSGNAIKMPKLGQICKMYNEIQQRVAKEIEEKGIEKVIEENGGSKDEINLSEKSSLSALGARYHELIGKLEEIAKKINTNEDNQKYGEIAINPNGTNSYAFITNYNKEEFKALMTEFSDFYKELKPITNKFNSLKKWTNERNHISIEKYDNYESIISDNKEIKSDIVEDDALKKEIENISKNKPINCNYENYYEAWVDTVRNVGYFATSAVGKMLTRNPFASAAIDLVSDVTFNKRPPLVYIYQDFGLGKIFSNEVNDNAKEEKNALDITKKYEQKLLNKEFKKVFKFEPTVENITRIIMAHVETFIYMISRCANNINDAGTNRTVENMGIKYENFPDIAKNDAIGATKDTIVAPFPKVVQTIEENGIKKTEDYWFGDVLDKNGKLLDSDKAEEIKLVEGILNGIAEALNDINEALGDSSQGSDINEEYAIKYPLTYFDFFIKRGDKPFGDVILSDVNNIFASMCVRAFSIMATQGENGVSASQYGMIDGENFLDMYKNDEGIKILGSMIKNITADKVIDFLTLENSRIDQSKKNNPWYKFKYLLSSVGDEYRLNAGHLGGKHAILPIKNWNFKQISDYAIRNDENPLSGLTTFAIDNYVITPQSEDKPMSPIIVAKDDSVLYFKNMYSRFASSIFETENETASKIFKNSGNFEFDYDKWLALYIGNWKPFLNSSGESVTYKECITYDDLGNVSSTNDCSLDFKNVFLDKSFLAKDKTSRAIEFIEKLFNEEKIINFWRKLCGFEPKFIYFGKFSILRCGAYFIKTKDNININPCIVSFFKKYFLDWAENVYPSIEANYMLDFKTGKNLETLKLAILSSPHTKRGIESAIGDNISDLSKFYKFYDVSDNNIKSPNDVDDININNSSLKIYLKTRSCSEMNNIIKDLMKIVCVCTTTKFNTTIDDYEKKSNTRLKKSQVKGYFEGFIETLKNGLNSYGDVNSDDVIVDVNNDPEDIKVGVYNYIKMLYDKWIASNSQDDFYRIESLFNGQNPTFHFLDSAYNKIGKSMYLNLSTMVNRIVQSQTQNGYTLLSMLSGLYADNKFLFLCIQNFLDLGRDDMMKKMFKPISYLDTIEPDNHPNFIVLMPYEPSSRLDIKGADYPDDTFYLNDERTWPDMIKSKTDNSHPIPAFGVCYGQQYQNYFKDIQVDMNAPMTTEQSIKAKFMIAGAYTNNENNGQNFITGGQDLYTIYSNNSYTCTVTMMGCAWVQPMMYFVLLNVPMFRGSYMIVKVNHQIQPGNMITIFKGVRMANTATRSVKQYIYGDTNESVGRAGYGGTYSPTSEMNYANIANDCNYAYYSPTGIFVDTLSEGDAQAYCYATYQSLVNAGLTPAQAKGICANIKAESEFNPYIITIDGNGRPESDPDHTHGVGGGLCGFYYYGRGKDLFEHVYGSAGNQKLNELNTKVQPYWEENPIPCSSKNSKKMAEDGLKYEIDFIDQVKYLCDIVNTKSLSGITAQRTEKDASWWWMMKYEGPSESYRTDRWDKYGEWVNSAIESMMKISPSNNTGAEKDKSIEEIANGLRESLERSLKASQYYNQTSVTVEKRGNNVYEYKASGTNATNALFDCLLSSYRQWFDQIRWYVGTGQPWDDAISARIRIVNTAPATHDISILFSNSGKNIVSLILQKTQLNESLRLILMKYFKSKNITQSTQAKSVFKSITRMSNELVDEIFEFSGAKSIRDCNSVMGEVSNGNGSLTGMMTNFSGEVSNPLMKKVLSHLNIFCNRHNYSNENEWYDVKGASPVVYGKTIGGRCTYAPSTWYAYAGELNNNGTPKSGNKYDLRFYDGPKTANHNNTTLGNYGFKMVWHGTIRDALALDKSQFRPGDISTQYYYKTDGSVSSHGCMYTGKDWRSDYVQQTIMANPNFTDRDGTYSVCIWRHPDFQEDGNTVISIT